MLTSRTALPLGVLAILAMVIQAAGNEAGKVYVVDQNHPKAGDENPGTPDAPWKTIAKAASAVQAGDTVYVMEGDYQESVKFARGGAKNKPIVFKGLPRRSAKMRGFDTTGCDYLRIEGFFITDTDMGVNVNSDYVSVVDNRFEGVQSTPIDTPDLRGEKPVGAYIAFNTIFKCGKGIITGGSNWLVERNEVTRLVCYGKGDADYTRPFGNKMVLRQNYLHGSTRKEVGQSHTDGFQVFDDNFLVARDILIEENVVNDFAEGLMMEVHYPEKGTIKNWTFRRNIMIQRGVDKGWAYANLCGGCEGFFAYGNTFITGSCMYAGAGNAVYEDNLFYGCKYLFPKNAPKCTGQKNLLFGPGEVIPPDALSNMPTDYTQNVLNRDPLLADLAKDNVRLKKGSPAIRAGVKGVTVGALEYPNVYYVDQRHGGASDDGFGYPGAPLKTIAKALSLAARGETVLVRGGVYRELVQAKAGVAIKAAKDEKVVISGADEIVGWKRDSEKWVAPSGAKPAKVLKDGKEFKDFTYDEAGKTITITGFDPRLHAMETVVRRHAIDLTKAPGTKIDGLETADTLGDGTTGRTK